MVTAPSATSSRRSTGALLEPQLSEPIQKKWPVWLALRAASSTLLWGHSNPAQTCMASQLPQPPCLCSRLYLDPARILQSRTHGYPCSQPQMIPPNTPIPLTAHTITRPYLNASPLTHRPIITSASTRGLCLSTMASVIQACLHGPTSASAKTTMSP